jgi:hypothetical protein
VTSSLLILIRTRPFAQCGTREAAKALGNEHFKESRLEDALACYLLAVDLCSASDGDYGEFAPTVYSNIALVYLKMKRCVPPVCGTHSSPRQDQGGTGFVSCVDAGVREALSRERKGKLSALVRVQLHQRLHPTNPSALLPSQPPHLPHASVAGASRAVGWFTTRATRATIGLAWYLAVDPTPLLRQRCSHPSHVLSARCIPRTSLSGHVSLLA